MFYHTDPCKGQDKRIMPRLLSLFVAYIKSKYVKYLCNHAIGIFNKLKQI